MPRPASRWRRRRRQLGRGLMRAGSGSAALCGTRAGLRHPHRFTVPVYRGLGIYRVVTAAGNPHRSNWHQGRGQTRRAAPERKQLCVVLMTRQSQWCLFYGSAGATDSLRLLWFVEEGPAGGTADWEEGGRRREFRRNISRRRSFAQHCWV